MPDVTVSLLKPGEEAAWDEFVRAAPDGTFFHLAGWRTVIEQAFGHSTFYLLAHRAGTIVGILPLTSIRSLIFGNALISNAFLVHGGPLTLDTEARDTLVREAIKIGRSRKADYLEFRGPTPDHENWTTREGLYVTFSRRISADHEANMKAIPRKQRAMIRKAISNGLTSRIDDDVDTLHEIYARSVHKLGTPVYAKRYFALMKQQFGDACDIVTILNGSAAIASVMNFYFRDEVLPYYGGGTQAARELAGNDLLYSEVMRRAGERGYRLFDFGRSKIGTGSYKFKSYWGFEPKPLSYAFLSLNGAKIPENNPLNPKFSLMVSAWQRLPFFATKLIGPSIVRSIG